MRAYRLILVIFICLLSSCNLTDYIDAGDRIIQRRNIASDVVNIDIDGLFSVTLVQDSVSFVDVNCPSNLQHLVDVVVDEQKLVLNNNISDRFLAGYDKVGLEIHLPNLNTINIISPSSICTQGVFSASTLHVVCSALFADCSLNIDAEHLYLSISDRAYATFNFEGSANTFNLSVYRMCSVSAINLETNKCQIRHCGLDDVYLNVNTELDAEIGLSGNIYYRGNPVITKTGNGSGQIISVE